MNRSLALRAGLGLALAAVALAGCGNGGGEWHEASTIGAPPPGQSIVDFAGIGAAETSPSQSASPSPSPSPPPQLGTAKAADPSKAKHQKKPPPADDPPPYPTSAKTYATAFLTVAFKAIGQNEAAKARADELGVVTDGMNAPLMSLGYMAEGDTSFTVGACTVSGPEHHCTITNADKDRTLTLTVENSRLGEKHAVTDVRA